jgi:hypothetical protein
VNNDTGYTAWIQDITIGKEAEGSVVRKNVKTVPVAIGAVFFY